MSEDEGGPTPIRDDPQREPDGTGGDGARDEDGAPEDEGAGGPGDEEPAAIDVGLAHDRAS